MQTSRLLGREPQLPCRTFTVAICQFCNRELPQLHDNDVLEGHRTGGNSNGTVNIGPSTVCRVSGIVPSLKRKGDPPAEVQIARKVGCPQLDYAAVKNVVERNTKGVIDGPGVARRGRIGIPSRAFGPDCKAHCRVDAAGGALGIDYAVRIGTGAYIIGSSPQAALKG